MGIGQTRIVVLELGEFGKISLNISFKIMIIFQKENQYIY